MAHADSRRGEGQGHGLSWAYRPRCGVILKAVQSFTRRRAVAADHATSPPSPPTRRRRLPLRSCLRLKAALLRRWWKRRNAAPLRVRLEADWHGGILLACLSPIFLNLSIGIWTSWPFFRYYVGTSGVFAAMAKVMPVEYWGGVFGTLGVLNALFYWSGHYALRRLGCALGAGAFSSITILLVTERVAGLATPMCPVIAALELARYAQLGSRRRQYFARVEDVRMENVMPKTGAEMAMPSRSVAGMK
jgi:hypothetical protein